jgi:hypothetical protein
MLMASSMVLMSRSANETTGRSTADNFANFQQIASQYFIANRTDMEAAMGGDATKAAIHCLINVPTNGTGTTATNSTKHTCAFDTTMLTAKGVWPASIPVNVNNSSRWVAIVRQVMSGSTATGADEMLIVLAPLSNGNVLTTGSVTFSGDIKRASEEYSAAMTTLGGIGGYIPPGQDFAGCQYNSSVKQACGTNWTVTLSDFIN